MIRRRCRWSGMLLVFAPAATLAAQLPVRAFAHTELVLRGYGFPMVRTIPAGTEITNGLTVSIGNPDPAFAFLATTLTNTHDTFTFEVQESAASHSFHGASAGPHATAVVVNAPESVVGRFVISWTSSSTVPGSITNASIDIGDDGVLEFVAASTPASVTLPARIPAGAFPIVIRTETVAAGFTHQNIRVRYEIDPFTVTPITTGCGVALAARGNLRRAADLVTTIPAGAGPGVCLQAFAFAPVASPVRLPCAPGCDLDIDLVAVVVANVQAAEAVLPIDLSAPGLRPRAFFAQSAWIDLQAATVVTSNAIALGFP